LALGQEDLILLLLNSITPVILAAGDSKRMGYPKALLPLGTDFFLTHILKMVETAGLGKPTVVLGRSASMIQSSIDLSCTNVLINPEPDRGQLSSMQLAFASLPPESVAAMIWPVDQPMVSGELVEKLARMLFASGSLIAIPVCGKKRGHPVIFRKGLFPEFLAAALSEGPKKVVLKHLSDMVQVPTDELGTVFDIDTPSDYEAIIGRKLDVTLGN